MKKQFFLLAFLFFSFQCFSQIKYEAGYFIDNDGIKTECLIKNVDWRLNPEQFKYKLNETSESKTQDINAVQEFVLDSGVKYKRAIVDIDLSSNHISNLSTDRMPNFVKDTIFLNVLIEGKATLFLYQQADFFRYFFSVDNSSPKQLIYKKYKVLKNNAVAENVQFRSQLWKEVNCGNLPVKQVSKTLYKKKDLSAYFIAYNECSNIPFDNFMIKQKSQKFKLSVKPGIRYSKLTTQGLYREFPSKLSFRLGIEAEFILPFHKNRWAFVLEPTFQYYHYKQSKTSEHKNVQYNSIEIPLSIKHYIFLNKNSKISIHAGYLVDLDLNSYLKFSNTDNKKEFSIANNFIIGAGYVLKNKYSIEFRYHTPRDSLRDYILFKGNYQVFELNFGYTIFSK